MLLVPLSPLLIYGYGPVPALGITGAGLAVLIVNALTGLIAAAYIFSDACIVKLRLLRLRWALFADILRVGAIATFNVLQTNLTIALATGLVGMSAGADGVAGYGTGARLEYLLIPLAFGFGGPLIALVGTNIGAGQKEGALRTALMGSGIAFAITEAVGIAGAIWPAAWLTLFGGDPQMLEIGSAYLRIVGPTYGFFGIGMALYFASQGAGRMLWLLIPGTLRVVVAVGGGYLALRLTGSVGWLFGAQALALVLYGGIIFGAVKGGIWFTKAKNAG